MKFHMKPLKNYLLLFGTQSLSTLGSGMTNFALVLWLYQQNGSALETALLSVCSYAPYVLMSIFAGALSDRWDKKRTMLLCDFFAALCTVAVLVLLKTDSLMPWHMYLLNTLNGLMNTVQQPAGEVVSTLLIPKEYYQKTAGLRSFANSLNTILTPIFAGALFALAGMDAVIAVDALASREPARPVPGPEPALQPGRNFPPPSDPQNLMGLRVPFHRCPAGCLPGQPAGGFRTDRPVPVQLRGLFISPEQGFGGDQHQNLSPRPRPGLGLPARSCAAGTAAFASAVFNTAAFVSVVLSTAVSVTAGILIPVALEQVSQNIRPQLIHTPRVPGRLLTPRRSTQLRENQLGACCRQQRRQPRHPVLIRHQTHPPRLERTLMPDRNGLRIGFLPQPAGLHPELRHCLPRRCQLQQTRLKTGQLSRRNIQGLVQHGLDLPVPQHPLLQPAQGGGVGGAQPSGVTHQHFRGVRGQVQDGCGFLRCQTEGQGRILPAHFLKQIVAEEGFHPVQDFSLLGLSPPGQGIQPGQHRPGLILG